MRIIVYAKAEQRATWVESELARVDGLVQIARTVEQIILALVEDPPPRPQILVVDLDAISPGELMHLHSIRERGWCGRIIGLGVAPPALRASLGVERVLNTPFVRDSLTDAISEIGFHATTKRIPLFDDAIEAAALPTAPPVVRPRILQMRTITREPAFTVRGNARVTNRAKTSS